MSRLSGLFYAATDLLSGMWTAVWVERCPVCSDRPHNESGNYFCGRCLDSFRKPGPEQCTYCGLPLPESRGEDPACGTCRSEKPRFEKARSAGVYEGALAHAIKTFKFQYMRRMAPALAHLAEMTWDRDFGDENVDGILPVPLHPSRLSERGFNQSADIGRHIALHGGVPFLHGVLVRTRPTQEQAGLTLAQRRENVRGAFKVFKASKINGKTLLLIDDVMTTGATVNECARILIKAGAKRVLVLTVARAV